MLDFIPTRASVFRNSELAYTASEQESTRKRLPPRASRLRAEGNYRAVAHDLKFLRVVYSVIIKTIHVDTTLVKPYVRSRNQCTKFAVNKNDKVSIVSSLLMLIHFRVNAAKFTTSFESFYVK